ncbi:MAG TPA: hypothetical protein VF955_01960 [Pyrinomonadaceae bacterium]
MLEIAKQETLSKGTHSPVSNVVSDGLTHVKVLEFGGYAASGR